MFCLRDERSHSGVGAYPPLEGEGRLTLSAAKCETGWGDGLSTPAPLETRDCHPTPPLISFASTLPLQGRVRKSSRRLPILGEVGELAQHLGGTHQPLLRRFPFLEEHHLHVGPHPCRLSMLADEIDQPVRLRELVVAESDDNALRPGIDLLDIGSSAIAL